MTQVILITGGRDFTIYSRVKKAILEEVEGLERVHIIIGCAQGADDRAKKVVEQNRISHSIMYADWNRYGRAAGPIRNQAMIDLAEDLAAWNDIRCLAFPGGSGTEGMIKLCERNNICVKRV